MKNAFDIFFLQSKYVASVKQTLSYFDHEIANIS